MTESDFMVLKIGHCDCTRLIKTTLHEDSPCHLTNPFYEPIELVHPIKMYYF